MMEFIHIYEAMIPILN